MALEKYDVKGIYIENITAEIFGVLADIIPETIDDKRFLIAQKKVRAIIAREYVEREYQKCSTIKTRKRAKNAEGQESTITR